MKANSTKRKIFDAVDLLTEDTSSQMPVKTMKGGVTMLDIDSIKPFHNHPFHLYEGDRLDDMVESIRDHGILNPVIVREIDDAIILSAVADYRAALKKVKRNPKSKSAIDEALQIEKFFRSPWYQQLTSVDGEFLIRKLQDEIRQSE